MNKEQQDILDLWEKLSLDSKRELIEVFLEEFPEYPSMEEFQVFIDSKHEQTRRYLQSRMDKLWDKRRKLTNEEANNLLRSILGDENRATAQKQSE